MASTLKHERDQYYLNENAMSRQCGICSGGYEAEKDLEGIVQIKSGKEYLDDEKITLGCGHTFHEFCIKGWFALVISLKFSKGNYWKEGNLSILSREGRFERKIEKESVGHRQHHLGSVFRRCEICYCLEPFDFNLFTFSFDFFGPCINILFLNFRT
jgi:hypothetical protein